MPPVLGGKAHIDALLVLTPGPSHAGDITTSYLNNGQVLRRFENALEDERYWHGFRIDDAPVLEPPRVELRVDPPTAHDGHLRIHLIRLVYRPVEVDGNMPNSW